METLDLKPVVEAVEEATGRRPHLSTVLRWHHRGRKGVRLKCWELGGRKLTTTQAVLDFIADVSAAGSTPQQCSPSAAARSAKSAKAKLSKRLAAR